MSKRTLKGENALLEKNALLLARSLLLCCLVASQAPGIVMGDSFLSFILQGRNGIASDGWELGLTASLAGGLGMGGGDCVGSANPLTFRSVDRLCAYIIEKDGGVALALISLSLSLVLPLVFSIYIIAGYWVRGCLWPPLCCNPLLTRLFSRHHTLKTARLGTARTDTTHTHTHIHTHKTDIDMEKLHQ